MRKVKEHYVTLRTLYRVVMVGYDDRQTHTKTTARSSLQNIFNVPVTTLIRQFTFKKDGHGADIWQLSAANDPVNFQDPATADIKLLLPSEDDAGRVKAYLLQVMEDAMPGVLTGAVSPEMQAAWTNLLCLSCWTAWCNRCKGGAAGEGPGPAGSGAGAAAARAGGAGPAGPRRPRQAAARTRPGGEDSVLPRAGDRPGTRPPGTTGSSSRLGR